MHSDNCGGQNKNKTVIGYLDGHVIGGLHEAITVSFMIAGHTRCLEDGHFGLLMRRYRRSDVKSMQQLAVTVDEYAATNMSHR